MLEDTVSFCKCHLFLENEIHAEALGFWAYKSEFVRVFLAFVSGQRLGLQPDG